jgi:phosphoglycerol transferase
LGAQIQGDKLGLGVNLFSSRETLTESYGQDRMQTEMNNRSEFILSKTQIDSWLCEILVRFHND